MAILVVLFGLVFAGLRRASEQASQTACLSNEHHITAGIALYTQDYDGRFPCVDNGEGTSIAERGWTVSIKPYSGALLSCPNCQRPGALATSLPRNMTTGYALNENLNGYDIPPGTQVGKYVGHNEVIARYPAVTVEILDARPCVLSFSTPDVNTSDGIGTYCRGVIRLIARAPEGGHRHGSGANYGFVDGHTKWYLPDQLDISTTSNGTRAGFGL